MHTGVRRAKGTKHRFGTCRERRAGTGKSLASACMPLVHNSRPASRGSPSKSWPDKPGWTGLRVRVPLPPNKVQGQALCQLPILFKIIQTSRKILEAVDLFVALATVKLKSLISEDAVQLGGKRVGATGMRSVSSGDSEDPTGYCDSTRG